MSPSLKPQQEHTGSCPKKCTVCSGRCRQRLLAAPGTGRLSVVLVPSSGEQNANAILCEPRFESVDALLPGPHGCSLKKLPLYFPSRKAPGAFPLPACICWVVSCCLRKRLCEGRGTELWAGLAPRALSRDTLRTALMLGESCKLPYPMGKAERLNSFAVIFWLLVSERRKRPLCAHACFPPVLGKEEKRCIFGL